MKRLFFLLALFITACSAVAYADIPGPQDSLEQIAKSEFFTIYAPKNVNAAVLLKNLDVFIYATGKHAFGGNKHEAPTIAAAIDAIYSEVSDALDIRIPGYHGTIKFLQNENQIGALVSSVFGSQMPKRSCYIHEQNTIYISLDDVTISLLGREIAHALTSRYFVTPPPAKIQDVLAGYIEYHLQKVSGKIR